MITKWAPDLTARHVQNCRMFPTRLELLSAVAPTNKSCIEVGVQAGNFSIEILRRTRPEKFYLLDVALGQITAPVDEVAREVGTELVRLEGLSTERLTHVPERSLHWAYIDADHSYEGVTQDLLLTMRAVKDHGLIICNDYTVWSSLGGFEYGVHRAVNEFMLTHDWEMVAFGLQGAGYHDVALRRMI